MSVTSENLFQEHRTVLKLTLDTCIGELNTTVLNLCYKPTWEIGQFKTLQFLQQWQEQVKGIRKTDSFLYFNTKLIILKLISLKNNQKYFSM